MTALVLKLGGDALATPERIAAAARRVALRRSTRPVVAVASARRGVTDHLLGLVDQVREAGGQVGAPTRAARTAADRAVTSGEVVAASLLAVALEGLGVPAVVLDAREAGVKSDGTPGEAALVGIRTARLERLMGRGTVPVVTGFQGWHRGRLTALGRGGSDVTAVALAEALGAEACELVKDPGAIHTADPRLVPEARPIAAASHRFVTRLAAAGARVIHHAAAVRAERDRIPLRFTSLRSDGEPVTVVGAGEGDEGYHSVVLASGHRGFVPMNGEPDEVATVSVVAGATGSFAPEALVKAATRAGATVLRTASGPQGLSFLVPAAQGGALLRALHAVLGAASLTGDAEWRQYASSG